MGSILYPTTDVSLPYDREGQVTDNVRELGSTYTLGQGIAVQRFLGPILAVGGIKKVRIELAAMDNEEIPPEEYDYITTSLTIQPTETAYFRDARTLVGFEPWE